ncbi:MAG TPA: ATP-binding cassette domain-containing protein [Geminicoccus sp.]|uniref:ABC transporter ATP-binding protein n=1 Tax=Geminicoccus sp. TaxID=2024832 RepID=UPI002CCDE8A3|nr:ATP-binding cassette domain-containing protein [Geminicoccus sp.]HWL72008.1 ATP-binding cassette domain-containing protein [Geminicoccus sp.]
MLAIEDLVVAYQGQDVLHGVSLQVEPGCGALVCGAGASGKSTLLATACGVVPRLVNAERVTGRLQLGTRDFAEIPRAELFSRIGIVFQNLDDQLFDLEVEDVIAAPLENRGVPRAEIRARLAELFEELAIQDLAGRRVLTLSGGERRMAVLAGALAARPELLVLDEPTTGLDPAARLRLERSLAAVRDRIPLILAADQDAASLAGAMGRIHLLQAGQLAGCWPTAEALALRTPWLEAGMLPPRRQEQPVRTSATPGGRVLLAVEGLRTRLARPGGEPVLHDITLELRAGEVTGLIGRNGAGKSTLIQTVLGLAPLAAGRIVIEGEPAERWTAARRARQVGYLPQNMRRMLFNLSVLDEIAFSVGGSTAKIGDPEVRARAAQALAPFGLADKAEASPFALSAREQALLGLACLDAAGCAVAILDEPLLARDRQGRAMLDLFLRRSHEAGRAVLLISHDLELIDDLCGRLLILADGRIAADGPTEQGWTSPAFRALGWPAPESPWRIAS